MVSAVRSEKTAAQEANAAAHKVAHWEQEAKAVPSGP